MGVNRSKVRIQPWLKPELKERLDEALKASGETLSDFVSEAIAYQLDGDPEPDYRKVMAKLNRLDWTTRFGLEVVTELFQATIFEQQRRVMTATKRRHVSEEIGAEYDGMWRDLETARRIAQGHHSAWQYRNRIAERLGKKKSVRNLLESALAEGIFRDQAHFWAEARQVAADELVGDADFQEVVALRLEHDPTFREEVADELRVELRAEVAAQVREELRAESLVTFDAESYLEAEKDRLRKEARAQVSPPPIPPSARKQRKR